MIGILYILWSVSLIFFVFLLFQSVGGKLLGARVEEIGVFNSPRIFKFNIKGIIFSFNAIPLGCFVKFSDDFEQLHPVRKLLIVLAGTSAYLVIALIGLGLTGALQQTLSGFAQYLGGAISPVAYGTKLIEAAANIFKERSFLIGLGLLASKFLAANLFPLGTLAGGQIIIYLLELIGFKSEKFRERFQLISLILFLPLVIGWIIALFVFIWRTFGV